MPPRLPRAFALAATAFITVIVTASAGLAAGPAAAAARPASSAQYTLHTEPGAGISWIYNLIKGAKSSIDLTMYELQDSTAEKDLGAAAARGVDVRVILDRREQSSNQAAYNYLSAHGAQVAWSSSLYYYTHEKCLVIDNATAAIMTLNLQSQYYSTSRDFGVVDTNASDVAAIVKVFNADFAGVKVTPGAGTDLVWSPTTSQSKLLALINDATASLRIYAEEVDDSAIDSALENAAGRGVTVQLVAENEDGEYDSEFSALAKAGVEIRYYSDPDGFYIHGKVIEADYGKQGARIFIGSQNFSSTSLNENRELGLTISSQPVMSSVESTFATDFANGTPWT